MRMHGRRKSNWNSSADGRFRNAHADDSLASATKAPYRPYDVHRGSPGARDHASGASESRWASFLATLVWIVTVLLMAYLAGSGVDSVLCANLLVQGSDPAAAPADSGAGLAQLGHPPCQRPPRQPVQQALEAQSRRVISGAR